MKRIKVVSIYFLILFLLCLGYFIESPVKKVGVYERIEEYFGITLFPTLLFFICYGLLFLLPKSLKRLILEVKLYLLLIVIILGIYIYIIFNSGLNFSITNVETLKNIKLDNKYFKSLIELCLYRYRIGYLPTYILWLILTLKIEFSLIFFTMITLQIVFIIYIIYGPIRDYTKRSYFEYKERKRLEKEEKLLLEQIKIKEALDKKETIKKIKFRENKERNLEEKIKIRKKRASEEFELKKIINLEEQLGDGK